MSEQERFTPDELELLFKAWALYRRGKAFVPEPVALPECYRLSERGWLERRWHGDDIAYRWSAKAETVLDVTRLTQTAKASTN